MKSKLFRPLGLVLATGALATGVLLWQSFTPAPAIAPSTNHASLSPPKSESKTRALPVALRQQQTTAAPQVTVEAAERDTPEHRCYELAERDPRAAVILALDTLPSDSHPGLLPNLTAQWAACDFRAAHEWVLQQRPSEWRNSLMARVAYIGSQSDPAAAARIVVEEISPGWQQDEAAISVLHQWALHDLNTAAAWAGAFPAGSLRTRALAEIEGFRKSRQMAAIEP
jgi:hypothetical protein